MNRALPLFVAVLLSLALLAPATLAHDPPPETSGLLMWLSDDQDPGRLLREGVGAAQDGGVMVTSGGEMRVELRLRQPARTNDAGDVVDKGQ